MFSLSEIIDLFALSENLPTSLTSLDMLSIDLLFTGSMEIVPERIHHLSNHFLKVPCWVGSLQKGLLDEALNRLVGLLFSIVGPIFVLPVSIFLPGAAGRALVKTLLRMRNLTFTKMSQVQ